MRSTDIEDAILSAFLFADSSFELNMDDVFILEATVFSTKYKQTVAEQINSVQDGFYSYLNTVLEEKTLGTAYEQEYIDIIAQNPLTLAQAKKYYGRLVKQARLKGAV